MENTTLIIPKLEEITQVYKHRKNKTAGCRCGCLGHYWKNDGTRRNARKIKEIYDIITAKIPTLDPKTDSVTETYADIWIGDRFITMYFEGKKSQT